MRLRIGVDVGGTNTDAVLMDGTTVVSKVKAPTSADVTSGVRQAVADVVALAGRNVDEVAAVMIGTTHFTNAFVQGRDLASVAAVRLCLPATQAVPPMIDWPRDAADRLTVETFWCHGGREFDGRTISPIDRSELEGVAARVRAAGLESVAVCGVYAPVDPGPELDAGAILSELLPDVPISLSHEIGRVGLLERENATLINASLRPLAKRTVAALRTAIESLGVTAPVFLSQNDGTIGTMEFTERYPVTTFTSGPTNSMRGASLLSGVTEAAVVDIGGTTADIGVLVSGYPRETTLDAHIGGVRTNFRLPDVESLGIGGGSLVRSEDVITVGPLSVGHAIRSEALVFGGSHLTATDVAVAAGRAVVGDPSKVDDLDTEMVGSVLEIIDREVAGCIDRMRTSSADLPVVLVGGGATLLGSSLPGCSQVIRPDHHEVANAVGAAMAEVGGSAEQIRSFAGATREEAIAAVVTAAEEAALAQGAVASTLRVVDVEEVRMAYLPGEQTRVRVRVVGELSMEDPRANDR